MSSHLLPDAGCERARAWSSLELDGELSQLEREFLAAHLSLCEDCARFAERLRAVTHVVRATPPERPERRLPLQLSAGLGRRRSAAFRVAVAATLAILAAGLGVLSGSLSRERPEPPRNPGGPVALLPSTPPNPSRAQDNRPRARPGDGERRPFRVGSTSGLSSRST
jgi:Putative zinc-finger